MDAHWPLESFVSISGVRAMCMASIHGDIQEAVEYARRCLPIAKESYRKIWYKLHTCPDSSKWSNLLQLSELVLSLPFTTSRVEQIFSLKLSKPPTGPAYTVQHCVI